jgi:hypothetical protein
MEHGQLESKSNSPDSVAIISDTSIQVLITDDSVRSTGMTRQGSSSTSTPIRQRSRRGPDAAGPSAAAAGAVVADEGRSHDILAPKCWVEVMEDCMSEIVKPPKSQIVRFSVRVDRSVDQPLYSSALIDPGRSPILARYGELTAPSPNLPMHTYNI